MSKELEQTASDEAFKACLGKCFEVLVVGLVTDDNEEETQARYRRCKEVCRKARAICQEELE